MPPSRARRARSAEGRGVYLHPIGPSGLKIATGMFEFEHARLIIGTAASGGFTSPKP
jgi:hypothetical protein